MGFKQQIVSSFIGTLFGFLFAIVLFLLTDWLYKKKVRKEFKKNLKREFQYNITLLQDWIDKIDVILRQITAKDREIYQYLKYSDLARYFLDESFKLGLIYHSFTNEQIFDLNKLVTHCSFSIEQFVNNKISLWKTCTEMAENNFQKILLVDFDFQKSELKRFKKLLEELLKKV